MAVGDCGGRCGCSKLALPLLNQVRRNNKVVLAVMAVVVIGTTHHLYGAIDKTSASARVIANQRTFFARLTGNIDTQTCPVLSEDLGLVGQLPVNTTAPTWAELERMFPDVQPGGRWRPRDCLARSRVQIVVPYRDRDVNFRAFLQHMHDFLPRQKLDYVIVVAEQAGNTTFNRGMMRNIGFMEGGIYDHYDCTVFNDLDLLPENDHNTYGCPDFPKHLCIGLDYRNYKALDSGAIFGGVVAFRNDHFKQVNGYSNYYFGWGAEDDDLKTRCESSGLGFYRAPSLHGRYTGMPHAREHRGGLTYQLFINRKPRMATDGLNSLQYKVIKREEHPLYTWVLADVDEDLYRRNASLFLDQQPSSKKKDTTKKPS